MSPDNAPLLELVDAARYFDVSAPWLNRAMERTPPQGLPGVGGGRVGGTGRPGGGRWHKVSAPVLRRPAAAGLDRPRAGDAPSVPDLRRADVGARCIRPGTGLEPDATLAARARPHLSVHFAQPG